MYNLLFFIIFFPSIITILAKPSHLDEIIVEIGEECDEPMEISTTTLIAKQEINNKGPNIPLNMISRSFLQEKNTETKTEHNDGWIFCRLSEATLKESPYLVIYCLAIAIFWLIFTFIICLDHIRIIVEKFHSFRQRRRREVNQERNVVELKNVFPAKDHYDIIPVQKERWIQTK